MRGFVAPTDYGWYQFLRARPELREVNFWRPSQNRFAALQPGELFFFKLKAPHDAIAGFGLFTRGAVLPAWEAWDVFGPANGTADLAELLAHRLDHRHRRPDRCARGSRAPRPYTSKRREPVPRSLFGDAAAGRRSGPQALTVLLHSEIGVWTTTRTDRRRRRAGRSSSGRGR